MSDEKVKTSVEEIVQELLANSAPQLEAFKVLERWLRIEHNLHLLNAGRGTWGVGSTPPNEKKEITYHGNLSLALADALERVKSKTQTEAAHE